MLEAFDDLEEVIDQLTAREVIYPKSNNSCTKLT